MSLTDESAALAPSEHAMRVELQAQVGRLESVIAVLKQQAANHQRNELESLEHVRKACRQRDEARAERDDANQKLAASQAEVARWSVRANDHQDALVDARALVANLTATVVERAAERDDALAKLAAYAWQPIETAPHTWHERQLFDPELGILKGEWKRDGWVSSGNYVQPTHWMPLPERPQ